MGTLKLPDGADTAFRIEATDAFGCRFALNAYGAGRVGWFVATHRFYGRDQDSGVRPLPKGEWPTLLHLIDRYGFWSLLVDDSHLIPPNVEVADGEFLTIMGRDTARYHRVHRFVWREPGLDAVLAFARRVSGFFVRHPVSGWWVPPAIPELVAQPQAPDAEPDAAPDPTA